jgi:hypothetical protein
MERLRQADLSTAVDPEGQTANSGSAYAARLDLRPIGPDLEAPVYIVIEVRGFGMKLEILLIGKYKLLGLTVKVFDNQPLGIGDHIHILLHNVVNHSLKYL